MSRRCCCKGCEVVIDNFERYNPDAVAGWTEEDGDSSVENLRLVVPAGGKIINNTPNTRGGRQVVYVDFWDPQIGDIYHIYVNSHNNGTPSPYVAIEVLSISEAEVTLYASDDSVIESRTVIWVGSADNALCENVTVCITEDYFLCILGSCGDPTSLIWTDQSPYDAAGRYAGLGSGANEIEFDNFEFWAHFYDDPECPECFCVCYDPNGATWNEKVAVPPKELTLTFVNTTGGCVTLEGKTITLTYQYPTETFTSPQWNSTDDPYALQACFSNWFQVQLTCADYPSGCQNWELSWQTTCNDHIEDAYDVQFGVNPEIKIPNIATTPCTCEPLYLLYGPWDLTWDDMLCGCCGGANPGTYMIEITE